MTDNSPPSQAQGDPVIDPRNRSTTYPVTRTHARLADGRELIYFDETDHQDRVLTDPRDLPEVIPGSQVHYDALLGEWVGIAASHRDRQ